MFENGVVARFARSLPANYYLGVVRPAHGAPGRRVNSQPATIAIESPRSPVVTSGLDPAQHDGELHTMARWMKFSSVVVGGLSAISSAGLTSEALAQDGAMTELYGYGVHRFYAGDYVEAQRVLNIVVESGIEDPRAHYFRGLTQHRMGALDAAKEDFEQAASLEARGRRVVNVSYALQRVQGPVRQEIEMTRLMARVALYKELRANNQLPPDPNARPMVPMPPAGDVTFPPALSGDVPPAAIPPMTPPAGTVPPASTPPAFVPDSQVDPFRDDAPAPVVPTPAATDPFDTGASDAPATPTAPAEITNNPFGTSETPAAPSTPADATVDPLGTTSPVPAVPTSPVTPPAETPAAPPAAPPATGPVDPFAT